MESSLQHILVSINKYYNSFSILPPLMKKASDVLPENISGASLHPYAVEVASVLIHNSQQTPGTGGIARNVNGNDTS
jgi:hypothetical protein